MILLGIDPGLKGGISVYKDNNYFCYEMPVKKIKKDTVLDIKKVIDILKDCSGGKCFLERSQAMPKQGVVSMFNYGKGYGILLGILHSFNIEVQEVTPQIWKKHFSLIKKEKIDSVSLAEIKNPKEEFRTKRGRILDGKAESFLILEWGKSQEKKSSVK